MYIYDYFESPYDLTRHLNNNKDIELVSFAPVDRITNSGEGYIAIFKKK